VSLNRLSYVLTCAALALTASAGPTTPQGAPRNADSVLRMMDASAKSFKSLTADIEHVKYTAVVKDTSTETGQIFVRHDQKMRVEILQPDKRTILRTGDLLFIYSPKINRVEEYNLGKNRSMIDQYLLLGFGSKSVNLRKSYDVSLIGEEDMDQRKAALLELTPKSQEVRAQITKIQMWIDEASWLPIQQKFYEATDGDYTVFHYTKIKENLKLGDSIFKQDWPRNAATVKPRV
jgi:outer membrane lipoprotein-sorting protein